VDSIAATTTRTGLKVEAELDTRTYDTGVKVTDAEIDALAMSRHRFHGDWNYTLHPGDPHPAPLPGTETETAATARPTPSPDGVDAHALRDPELTGMTVAQLDSLVGLLIPALAQRREPTRHERRGGKRRRTRGAGAKDKLSDADRILATVLCLRKIGTHDLLARLFGVTGSTLTRAVQAARPLLAEHGHAIHPSTARFRTPTDVAAHLDQYGTHPPKKIKPACQFSASP
jgi:Rhodopirellula transposase.